jgi:hypothetical protein
MSTSPLEILELAGRIRDANPDECGRRSAASRAYYSALMRTREVFGVAPRLPPPQADSSHRRIIRAAADYATAGRPLANKAAIVAESLARMQMIRNVADYDIHLSFPEASSRDMFIRANAIKKACDEVAAAS